MHRECSPIEIVPSMACGRRLDRANHPIFRRRGATFGSTRRVGGCPQVRFQPL